MARIMYESQTMGNVVETRREVVAQIIESAVKFRTLDLKWKTRRIGGITRAR